MELCDIVCPACLNYWSLISLSYIHLFFLYPMSCSIGHFVFPQSSIWSTAFISDTDVPLCLDAKLLSILTPSLSLFFSHSYSLSHTISLIHSFSLSYSSSLLFLSHSLSSPIPHFPSKFSVVMTYSSFPLLRMCLKNMDCLFFLMQVNTSLYVKTSSLCLLSINLVPSFFYKIIFLQLPQHFS